MILKPYNDNTKYKALWLGHYHNRFEIKTRKKWNDIYMIDVSERKEDFVEVKDD